MATLSIELSFDEVSNQQLTDLWNVLGSTYAKRGDSQLGLRPHVSLAVFREDTPRGLEDILQHLAEDRLAFPLRFAGAGAFPTGEGVVFLEAQLSSSLRDAHGTLMELLGSDAPLVHPYYRPAAWKPHCTVATGVPEDSLGDVTAECFSRGYPAEVIVRRVSAVHYHPLEERVSIALGTQGAL